MKNFAKPNANIRGSYEESYFCENVPYLNDALYAAGNADTHLEFDFGTVGDWYYMIPDLLLKSKKQGARFNRSASDSAALPKGKSCMKPKKLAMLLGQHRKKSAWWLCTSTACFNGSSFFLWENTFLFTSDS